MDSDLKKNTGKYYDIQGFSVHDGPGIRITLFLKGCPLRCLWCHSPESQAFPSELNWMAVKCIGIETCGKCLSVCPNDSIQPGSKRKSIDGEKEITIIEVDREKCDNCGSCAEACPAKALYICGDDYSVEEIMEKVRRDIPFYNSSGGGVTISGGECLFQPDHVVAVLKQCKEEGIHTAVDTTGFAEWSTIEQVLPYTDVFLYDLKHMDSDRHKQATGVPNERILENAKKIANAGGKLQIRIPVIPLYNETDKDFDAYGQFIKSLGDAVELVQLLPYHNLGVVKWERLSKTGPVLEASTPPDELIQARRKQLEDFGLKVTIH